MGSAPSMGSRLRPRRRTLGPHSSNWFERLAADAFVWPADIERVRTWYEPHLERLHEDAIPRLADLRQLGVARQS